MRRGEVIAALAAAVSAVERPHPVRVAIDGVDAAGKTTLGDKLARQLSTSARMIIRASIDGFHNPPEIRYRCGRLSPEGYYRDSFDYTALHDLLLDPLGPQGSLTYRSACFDVRAEEPQEASPHRADPDALLICDGIFMLRPELRRSWDFTVFLDVSFAVARQRGVQRDASDPGDLGEVVRRYRERYIPGQELYLQDARPKQHADVVVANDDPAHPRLSWRHADR